jgi:hypothetical protein
LSADLADCDGLVVSLSNDPVNFSDNLSQSAVSGLFRGLSAVNCELLAVEQIWAKLPIDNRRAFWYRRNTI